MTSDEGDFYHKATSVDGTACGVYIVSEPDQRIEIHFNYLDVPCENGGLVSVRYSITKGTINYNKNQNFFYYFVLHNLVN